MSREQDHAPHPHEDEPPPILRSWAQIYSAVIVYLAILICVFYIFARVLNS